MKKKMFYLLLILLAVFSFNNTAKADELNCEYRLNNRTIVLARRKDKKFEYYYYQVRKDNPNLSLPIDSKSWKKVGGFSNKWKVGVSIPNNATKCPAHADAIKLTGGYGLRFYNKRDKTLAECDSDSDSICNGYLIDIPEGKKTTVTGEDENELKEKLSKNSCDKIDLKNTWLSPSTVDNHTHSCLYSYSSGNSCALAQIDYSYDAGLVGNSSYEMFPKPGYIAYDISFSDITISGIRNLSPNLSCPANIYFKETPRPPGGVGASVYKGSFSLVKGGEQEFKLERYQYKDADGNVTDDPSKSASSKPGSLLKSNSLGEITCDDIVGSGEGSLQELLKNGLLIARILVPIAVIALSAADISTAIFGEEDKMKKAQAKFIKRLIIAIAFFLTPSLLKLILTLANSIWPTISSDFCGIL